MTQPPGISFLLVLDLNQSVIACPYFRTALTSQCNDIWRLAATTASQTVKPQLPLGPVHLCDANTAILTTSAQTNIIISGALNFLIFWTSVSGVSKLSWPSQQNPPQ